MENVMIIANALAKCCNRCSIIRLDIHYNTKEEMYIGRCHIGDSDTLLSLNVFDIYEDGRVFKVLK